MVVHRLSSFINNLEEGRVPQGMRFFSMYNTIKYYLRIEIINTINVANAIIKDNASYTLMLITSLSRGKPNTSNYLMYGSITNVCFDGKIQEPPDHMSYTMARRFLCISFLRPNGEYICIISYNYIITCPSDINVLYIEEHKFIY